VKPETTSAPLSEYDQKRDFQKTPEPGPDSIARASPAPRFMVHKHHARRLHYDLRLEIDGALASWAVPRGPSYDPHTKRLAVQTEDHPLAYGDFEGRIPDGLYGAGDSLVWDRGHFDTIPPGRVSAMRKKGHIHFALRGEKLRGEWHLLRTTAPDGSRAHQGDASASGPKAQWILVKVPDAEADPSLDICASRPESVLTGAVETRGPAGAAQGAAAAKPSMPTLLATGVLGGALSMSRPLPLFARVPPEALAQLPLDVARPRTLLDLPAALFGEEELAPAPGAAEPGAELLFLLERTSSPRAQSLGPAAEVALVLRDLFEQLGLDALACTAGLRALLLRVALAPAPAQREREHFASRIAETLRESLELVRSGDVQIDRSLNQPGASVPAPFESLPAAPGLVCAPIDWRDVSPQLAPKRFGARWLARHREAAQALVDAHAARAAVLPRAR